MSFKHLLYSALIVSSGLAISTYQASAATVDDLTIVDEGTSIAISGCSQTAVGEMVIPTSINDKPVTSIRSAAFSQCSLLTSVSIPAGVTSIEPQTFHSCIALKSVNIPSTVTIIDNEAFFHCEALTKVKLPNNVTRIGNSAFESCVNLTSLVIPSHVNQLGDSAFMTCSKLMKVNFLGNAPTMGTGVFNEAAVGFTIFYYVGKIGFKSPLWHGYHAVRLGPDIAIQQPLGSNLIDGESKRNFGTVKVGKAGTSKTFMIKNKGTAILSGLIFTRIGTDAKDFTVTIPELTSLEPGASSTFKVNFRPTAKGTRKAAIRIRSNDANENPFDITVTGTGAAK